MKNQKNILMLIEDLDTPRDTVAEKVIQKLIKVGDIAVPLLIESAENKSAPRIRKWSLQAIGAIGDSRGASVLIRALEHNQMTIKLHAIRGLTRMKYKKAAKKISKLLKDESGGVRVNALASLIELNDKSTAKAIVASLEDPMWYVRQSACLACGHFKIIKTKKKLKQLFESDPKKAVRNAAVNALETLEVTKVKKISKSKL